MGKRSVLVFDNIKLTDLCEYIIVSMNGKKIPIYDLEYGRVTYYPIEFLDTDIEEYEKSLENLTLKDLNLKKNKHFYIEYDFDSFYNFIVKVDDMYDDIISIIETTYLNEKNKISRTRYLLSLLKNEGKIYNDDSSGLSCWKLK